MKLKPWLWLPPQWAHDLNPYGLKFFSFFYSQNESLNWGELEWSTPNRKKLIFKNPLGIAGGVDKNGSNILDWQNLNAGFIEVGTVTPQPQAANSGQIINRDHATHSLWNKMGFPSIGSQNVKNKILKIKNKINIPLFINIGKNRTTSNEEAFKDYTYLFKEFLQIADAFVINISSPNTQGLRDLLTPDVLNSFLSNICNSYESLDLNSNIKPALLIKLSPDIDDELFELTILTCLKHNIDGFILTNTTLNRKMTPNYPIDGGVSGAPLKSLSLKALKKTKKICLQQNCKKMIISTGGVMTADDVFERIRDGADLVQVYTALVFNGPYFFRKVAQVAKFNRFKKAD